MFVSGTADAQVNRQAAVAAPTAPNKLASATVGQTITLDNTSFKVSTKKQLAKGVEYYTMTESTANSPAVTYLRTNEAYARTVFAADQYSAFLKTGRMSSFGTLKQEVYANGSKVNYVTKGSTDAYMLGNGKGLSVVEITSVGRTTLPTDAEIKTCKSGCFDRFSACIVSAPSASTDAERLVRNAYWDACSAGYGSCAGACYFASRVVVSVQYLSSGTTVRAD